MHDGCPACVRREYEGKAFFLGPKTKTGCVHGNGSPVGKVLEGRVEFKGSEGQESGAEALSVGKREDGKSE